MTLWKRVVVINLVLGSVQCFATETCNNLVVGCEAQYNRLGQTHRLMVERQKGRLMFKKCLARSAPCDPLFELQEDALADFITFYAHEYTNYPKEARDSGWYQFGLGMLGSLAGGTVGYNVLKGSAFFTRRKLLGYGAIVVASTAMTRVAVDYFDLIADAEMPIVLKALTVINKQLEQEESGELTLSPRGWKEFIEQVPKCAQRFTEKYHHANE